MRDPLGPMEPSLSPLYRILCFLRGVTALCPSYFKKTLPYPTQPATGNWVFDWQVSATVLCRLVGHEKEVSKVQFFGTEEFFFPRKPRCSPIHRGRVSPIPVSAGVFLSTQPSNWANESLAHENQFFWFEMMWVLFLIKNCRVLSPQTETTGGRWQTWAKIVISTWWFISEVCWKVQSQWTKAFDCLCG